MYCFGMNTTELDLALSDQTRLRIIDLLGAGEKCVCDLQDAVGAAQSRLSFHLRVLRDAGVVSDRKQGRWNFYSLRPEALAAMAAYLGGYQPGEATWVACACGEIHEGRCCG